MSSNIFQKLLPDVMLVVKRFPVPVLVSLFMYAFFVLEIEDAFAFNRFEVQRVFQAGVSAFLIAGGVHLFGESRGWSFRKTYVLALLLAVAIAAILYFQQFFAADAVLIIPAAILWVMIAGFLRSATSFNAVWLFNSRLVTAAVLATIVGLVFSGGIAAILASLDYLFGVKISDDAYQHVFNLAIAVIGPVYGLALLPDNIDEELLLPRGNDMLNRGVSILINYVLVPVLLAYVVILHAYAAKIGFSWTLPRGKVGIMVLIFGIGGTATWLIARPWVETGTRMLQFFTRHWFWFTIIPTLLLALAVFVRIEAYGVTPERYGLVLVAAWLALMVGYFAMKRIEAKPQFIMGSMALLLLAGSFGPWGAYGLSINSQFDRLVKLLDSSGFMENGKIAAELKVTNDTTRANRNNARSIVGFLQKHDALEQLEPLFDGHASNPFARKNRNKYTIASDIHKLFGYDKPVTTGESKVYFRATGSQEYSIPQASILLGPLTVRGGGQVEFKKIGVVSVKNGQVHISRGENSWQIGVKDLLQKIKKEKVDSPLGVLVPAARPSGGRNVPARLLLKQLTGDLDKGEGTIRYMTFWLVLPTTR